MEPLLEYCLSGELYNEYKLIDWSPNLIIRQNCWHFTTFQQSIKELSDTETLIKMILFLMKWNNYNGQSEWVI